MLAFSKDISQKEPRVPQEAKDAKLKDYMDYQRKLNNSQIVYHSLKYAKNPIGKHPESLPQKQTGSRSIFGKHLSFFASFCRSQKTLILMIKKVDQRT